MQPASFFFYDLETTGINSRDSRIMQFAGQRTDMQLNPIGEPVDVFIKLARDVLPDPEAVLLTGITPQTTLVDGYTEAEFLKFFTEEVSLPRTIFVGYNTIRFDDEFMRCLHYRNFYDAYEWQWQDERGRWDLLDVVRMTRALRPEGIQWPVDDKGNATNRLELLTTANKLNHEHAHDALSDVYATLEIAKLIRAKQPKLFEFMLDMRDKKKVAKLVEDGQPFVYTSGQYPGEFEKTTVAIKLCDHPKNQGVFVYDLRQDPTKFKDMTVEQIVDAWAWKKDRDPKEPRLPVKKMQYNKCPAVAPLGVLNDESRARLKVDLAAIKQNLARLRAVQADFIPKLCRASEMMDETFQKGLLAGDRHVDGQLYDGFFGPGDKQAMQSVRTARPAELSTLNPHFKDKRLAAMWPLYKGRNFPKNLSSEEREIWDAYCQKQLLDGGQQSRMAKYLFRLQELAKRDNLSANDQYLLEELKLYAESIMPETE